MSLIKTVATQYEVDGRQFVDVEDFLACYPGASEKVKNRIKQELKAFGGDVEKRIEKALVERLIGTCWNAKGQFGALNAPIVLRDGWVIWVSKGHEPLIDSLGQLYVSRPKDTTSLLDKIKILSGEVESEPCVSNTDLLTAGHAWYISTTMPKIIWTGEAYRPTRADKSIFSTFQVRNIDE